MGSSIPVLYAPYRITSVASSFGTGASIQSTSARSTLTKFGRLLEQRKSTSARNPARPPETVRSVFASQSSRAPLRSHPTSRPICRQVVPDLRRQHQYAGRHEDRGWAHGWPRVGRADARTTRRPAGSSASQARAAKPDRACTWAFLPTAYDVFDWLRQFGPIVEAHPRSPASALCGRPHAMRWVTSRASVWAVTKPLRACRLRASLR